MNKLPTELLGLILSWTVRLCRCEKNTILPLRSVCKAFDNALKPYVFKTLQLEFSRFIAARAPGDHDRLVLETIQKVGLLSSSVYIDMMVVRDEGMCEMRF